MVNSAVRLHTLEIDTTFPKLTIICRIKFEQLQQFWLFFFPTSLYFPEYWIIYFSPSLSKTITILKWKADLKPYLESRKRTVAIIMDFTDLCKCILDLLFPCLFPCFLFILFSHFNLVGPDSCLYIPEFDLLKLKVRFFPTSRAQSASSLCKMLLFLLYSQVLA